MEIENQDMGYEDEVDTSVVENADVVDYEEEGEDQVDQTDDKGQGDEEEIAVIRKSLEKKNRYINNLRSRHKALKEHLHKIEMERAQNTAKPPNENDFQSYMEYLEAKNKHEIENQFGELKTKQEIDALQQQQQLINEQMAEQSYAQYQEIAEKHPDIRATMESPEVMQIVQALPPHIDSLFDEVDNPALAGYVLAKEGRLAALANMHPQVALVEIVQALHRADRYISPKQRVSKAPAPIAGARGTGAPVKSLSDMTPDQLVKHLAKIGAS